MADAQGFLKPEGAKRPQQEISPTSPESQEKEMDFASEQERAQESTESSRERAAVAERPVVSIPTPVQTVQKDPELAEIEDVLSKNMTDLFLALPPDRQQIFKQKGEEAARKIQRLMDQGKATARRVFDIIREWLRGLPMINRFFLEQEAKIKTDQVVAYVEGKQHGKF